MRAEQVGRAAPPHQGMSACVLSSDGSRTRRENTMLNAHVSSSLDSPTSAAAAGPTFSRMSSIAREVERRRLSASSSRELPGVESVLCDCGSA